MQVGDRVLKYIRFLVTRMVDKLEKRFMGPFTIHQLIGRGVYRLLNAKGNVMKQVANANNLKAYVSSPPASPNNNCRSPQSPISTEARAESVSGTSPHHESATISSVPTSCQPSEPNVKFNNALMREHLAKCFDRGVVEMFPQKALRGRRNAMRKVVLL